MVNISVDYAYGREPSRELIQQREVLYNNFRDQFEDLLTSKIPFDEYSKKGRLVPRLLYRHMYDDTVFKISENEPSSETAVIAAIDASGSMDGCSHIPGISQMDMACAIMSAFAKANREVCEDKIRLEVFTKTATYGSLPRHIGVGDYPCFLTRIFSNRTEKTLSPDRLFGWQTSVPVGSENQGSMGSITPEYACLPGLHRWIEENIKEPNIVFINLTDGEPWYQTGHVRFGIEDVRTMRNKYLRDIEDVNIFLNTVPSDRQMAAYGERNIIADSDSFTPQMMDLLYGIMDQATD